MLLGGFGKMNFDLDVFFILSFFLPYILSFWLLGEIIYGGGPVSRQIFLFFLFFF